MTNSNGAGAETSVAVDADRSLILAYTPAHSRAGIRLLWELDTLLGNVVAQGRQPLVVQMRLAWWREALAGLDQGRVPSQPLLVGIADTLLSPSVSGKDLAGMVDGWERLLAEAPISSGDLQRYAAERGGLLFGLSAIVLGSPSSDRVEGAGAAWALADLARRSSLEVERRAALYVAATYLPEAGNLPAGLRPLAMLTALARRDVRRGPERIESAGAPARVLAMLLASLFAR